MKLNEGPLNLNQKPENLDIDSPIYLSLPKKVRLHLTSFGGEEPP